MIWESIVFSVLILVAAGGGFALGHLFTMRSIAHVQPSASGMPETGSVYVPPDPFELDEAPTTDEEQAHETIESTLRGLGLDLTAMRATMPGTPMRPAGVVQKADISFINKSEPEAEAEAEEVVDNEHF